MFCLCFGDNVGWGSSLHAGGLSDKFAHDVDISEECLTILVGEDVTAHIGAVGKGTAASRGGAFVRTIASVCAEVALQGTLLREALAARGPFTRKWSLVGVLLLVAFHGELGVELHSTVFKRAKEHAASLLLHRGSTTTALLGRSGDSDSGVRNFGNGVHNGCGAGCCGCGRMRGLSGRASGKRRSRGHERARAAHRLGARTGTGRKRPT